MTIYGLNKLTLIDFPEQLACTVFLGGCNFRCPFCHNGGLVLNPSDLQPISTSEFFNFLGKRVGIIDGVVISGGEPTLSADLEDFIKDIKKYPLLVKLDTNGSNPQLLARLVEEKLIDYVAMDIKTQKEQYPSAIGIADIDMAPIKASVDYLLSGKVNYEFRTTVCKELHSRETLINIGQWIKNCSAYYLQKYQDGENILAKSIQESALFHPYSDSQMLSFAKELTDMGIPTFLRGV